MDVRTRCQQYLPVRRPGVRRWSRQLPSDACSSSPVTSPPDFTLRDQNGGSPHAEQVAQGAKVWHLMYFHPEAQTSREGSLPQIGSEQAFIGLEGLPTIPEGIRGVGLGNWAFVSSWSRPVDLSARADGRKVAYFVYSPSVSARTVRCRRLPPHNARRDAHPACPKKALLGRHR